MADQGDNLSTTGSESPHSQENGGGDEAHEAQNGGGDEASAPADKAASITIRVINQMGETMKFRTKRTSLIHRLLDVYCKQKGVRKKELRFRYDGHSIAENATPETMGMEDDEIIEVFSEQIGGGTK